MVVAPTLSITESSSFDQRDQRYGSKGMSQKRCSAPKGIFAQLLRRMNPTICLGACNGDMLKFSSFRRGGTGGSSSSSSNRSGSQSGIDGNEMDSSVAGYGLRSIVPDLMKDIDFTTATTNANANANANSYESRNISTTSYQRRKRNLALKSLYELSSVKRNRVPLVCTQKYNVIPILAKTLTMNLIGSNGVGGDNINDPNNHDDETRRMTCLTLNQLSLPFQNKKIMVFGNGSDILITNLLHVINLRLPETYLCFICLMNLTYLDMTVEPIIRSTTTPRQPKQQPQHHQQSQPQFSTDKEDLTQQQSSIHHHHSQVPLSFSISNRPKNIDPTEWNNFPSATRVPASRTPIKGYLRGLSPIISPCLDDPNSLLRSIESLMKDHRPFLMSKVLSVEGEAIRWSVGLLRNLTKKKAYCSIIAKTDIPCLVLSFIQQSPHPIIRWSKDSLEQMSLTVLGNMASCEETRSLLKACHAVEVLRQLEEERERLGLSLNTATLLTSLEL